MIRRIGPTEEQDIEAVRRLSPERKLAVMHTLIHPPGVRAQGSRHPSQASRPPGGGSAVESTGARRGWDTGRRPLNDPDNLDLIGLFVEPLERLGLVYMITGGVASVVYGDPRFTRDVDVVLELDEADAESLESAFSHEEFYVPPRSVLLEESARPGGRHFNIIHRGTALRAAIYTAGDDPLHGWALRRRSRIDAGGTAITLAPIEYVIVRKLQYFRDSGSDRHLRDVAMMLRVSGDTIDGSALEEWIGRLELETEWERARGYEPS